MEPQRQRSGGGRRRKRRGRGQPFANPEPVLIVARRPDSPLMATPGRRPIAASASPELEPPAPHVSLVAAEPEKPPPPVRREARIVQIASRQQDARERERQRLLAAVLSSEGRIAISRAADKLMASDIAVPGDQTFQLQMLEHLDETKAREAIGAIAARLQKEAPHKKPVMDQRLRRLEEHGEDICTREAAAALRRALRL